MLLSAFEIGISPNLVCFVYSTFRLRSDKSNLIALEYFIEQTSHRMKDGKLNTVHISEGYLVAIDFNKDLKG